MGASGEERTTLRARFLALSRGSLVLIVAVVAGAVLRVLGTTWGLPYQLHPDEWVIVTGAVDLAQRHSFEPAYYFRPDHVEIQLSYLVYTAYSYLVLHLPVEIAYSSAPAHFILLSRLITAAFGVASIVLAYFIGRRVHVAVGAIAAVIFALYPTFVEHSHFATPDIPLTTAFLAIVIACMSYLDRPRYSALLVASAATSVAIAIKYPGALATLMIAVVVIVAAIRERVPARILTHGAAAVAAVIGFLFLISPVLFTNAKAVMAAIVNESRTSHPGADGLGWGGNLLFYSTQFIGVAGILVAIAALVGVVAAIRGRMTAMIPVALGAVFWVILSALPLHWDRWGVPMLISPLLFAALGFFTGYRALRDRVASPRWRRSIAIVVSGIVLLNLTVGAIAVDARLLAVDTRISTMPLVADLGITEENAVWEGYSPLLPAASNAIFDDFRTVDGMLRPVNPDVQWVVTSSCDNDRYAEGDRFAEERAFYEQLSEDFVLEEFVAGAKPWTSVPIEPWNIVGLVGSIAQFSSSPAACDIGIYSVPPVR